MKALSAHMPLLFSGSAYFLTLLKVSTIQRAARET
jgi:hypothetical protein